MAGEVFSILRLVAACGRLTDVDAARGGVGCCLTVWLAKAALMVFAGLGAARVVSILTAASARMPGAAVATLSDGGLAGSAAAGGGAVTPSMAGVRAS